MFSKLIKSLIIVVFLSPAIAVKAMPTIQILTENWPPFNYRDKDGEIKGTVTDKVKKLFDIAGIKYTISLYPWVRAYHLAQHQPNTAVYTIVQTPERKALFQWVCPVMDPQPMYFFRLASRKDIQFDTIEGARNYVVSVAKDELDHHFLISAGFIENVHFEVSIEDETNLKKLLIGRVDLVLETEHSILEYIQKYNLNKNTLTRMMMAKSAFVHQHCLAFSLKTDPKIVTKVRQALQQFDPITAHPKTDD